LGANIGEVVKATVGKRSSVPFKSTSVDWSILVRKIEHGVVIMEDAPAGYVPVMSHVQELA
jgi:hypothetical protein